MLNLMQVFAGPQSCSPSRTRKPITNGTSSRATKDWARCRDAVNAQYQFPNGISGIFGSRHGRARSIADLC
jgi:hypothetical protein